MLLECDQSFGMGGSAGGKMVAIKIGTIKVELRSEIPIPILLSDLVVS